MARYIGPLAWAWLIIIGVLMITPRGPIPISFESTSGFVLGAISIVLGGAAFALSRLNPTARF